MNIYPELFGFAEEVEANWENNESVDWQEAEDLVTMLERMPQEDRGELQFILDYAEANDDWDSGVVAEWPSIISSYLDVGDKIYSYRPHGENWEVIGTQPSGNEDWVGTVSTETAAQGFVAFLSGALVPA